MKPQYELNKHLEKLLQDQIASSSHASSVVVLCASASNKIDHTEVLVVIALTGNQIPAIQISGLNIEKPSHDVDMKVAARIEVRSPITTHSLVET